MSHQARKRFGQHFLRDADVIERILSSIQPARDDRLVEIGPGLGALTRPLLNRVAILHAVELDRDIVARLRAEAPGPGALLVHQADALKFDFRALAAPQQPLRIVGNLPYNISTPLLFHLLDQLDCIRDMHFMLQKEVVDRMAAGPGGRTYGRLSVMVALKCAVTSLFDVDREAFRPPPKVTSAVVRLQPHPPDHWRPENADDFAELVAQAFSMRRKTLRNSLRSLLEASEIEAAGIDPGDRPERLSTQDFGALSDALTRRRRASE